MLEVGITNTQSAEPPLSFVEARTHFGAWAIVSAPLIIGMNLSDADTMSTYWPIVSNAEAIAVNQEYAGFSGSRFYASLDTTYFSPCGWWLANCTFPSVMYWWKPLPNGDTAVLLMNNGESPALLSVEWDTVPGLLPPQGTTVGVRDVWNQQSLGDHAGAFVPAAPTASRDSIFLRLTPRTS
jgi:alpha-galactosidase